MLGSIIIWDYVKSEYIKPTRLRTPSRMNEGLSTLQSCRSLVGLNHKSSFYILTKPTAIFFRRIMRIAAAGPGNCPSPASLQQNAVHRRDFLSHLVFDGGIAPKIAGADVQLGWAKLVYDFVNYG